MGNKKKILFSDLDGTLYFRKGTEHFFREEDKTAITEFRRQGNLFVVNSGRPLTWIQKPLAGEIEADYIIAGTGAVITDGRGHVLFEKSLPADLGQKLPPEITKKQTISLYGEKGIYIINKRHECPFPITGVSSIEEVKDKLFSFSTHFDTVEAAGAFVKRYQAEIAEVNFFQNEVDVDAVSAGCSKGAAVKWLTEKLGLSYDDCHVIGDSYNDIPMLKSGGCSYTFPETSEAVRESADRIVSGVAELIRGL